MPGHPDSDDRADSFRELVDLVFTRDSDKEQATDLYVRKVWLDRLARPIPPEALVQRSLGSPTDVALNAAEPSGPLLPTAVEKSAEQAVAALSGLRFKLADERAGWDDRRLVDELKLAVGELSRDAVYVDYLFRGFGASFVEKRLTDVSEAIRAITRRARELPSWFLNSKDAEPLHALERLDPFGPEVVTNHSVVTDRDGRLDVFSQVQLHGWLGRMVAAGALPERVLGWTDRLNNVSVTGLREVEDDRLLRRSGSSRG